MCVYMYVCALPSNLATSQLRAVLDQVPAGQHTAQAQRAYPVSQRRRGTMALQHPHAVRNACGWHDVAEFDCLLAVSVRLVWYSTALFAG